MWSRSIVLCFCAQLFRPAYSICTVSKYSEGYGDWVKCGAATVSEALQKGGPVLAAITISQSRIPNILENAFVDRPSLQALTLQNCGIREVHPNAFTGLRSLKKLNMPNNNISRIEPKWFVDLVLLEQLDLSFNLIRDIDALAIARLTNLRRLNLDDNSLTCLDPKDMEPMRSIAKIRVLENPLSLTCRGRMTLWFHDKGINYSSGLAEEEPESWLDRVLWLCAEDGYGKTRSEKTMRECVALNIFNQLRLALKTSDSYPISAQQCRPQTQAFMKCIAKSGREPGAITNGEAMTNIVLAMRAAQEEMKIN